MLITAGPATAIGRPTAAGHPEAGEWTRADWAALADHLLLSLRPYASPGHGRITPPGTPGGYGHAVDGLEGFARSFFLAACRLAGDGGADPLGLAEWYAEGLASGVDPTAPDRWVRLDEHGQPKVEAASLVLALDLTRPWLWDRLSSRVQNRLIAYLAPAVGDRTYPKSNWLWFHIVTQTFLRSVGGPWSADDIAADLALHDSFVRAEGWLADGSDRTFDHYIGWALHFYPILWAHMTGARDLLEPSRAAADVARLDRYLTDLIHLVGADGAPLCQGRSLIYRYATAAPFWAGALAGVPSTSPGLLRRAASGVAAYFTGHGAPDERGLLTLGWWHEWRRLAQSYSGPGSPYWAAHGFLGLALPETHPVWTAPAESLPVERADFVRAIAAPGWLVSGTVADGIVRIVNHGTDHATSGARVGDSPLYARLGYATATAPLLDPTAWTTPLEQSVTLVDQAGRASHRAGFRPLALSVDLVNVALTNDGGGAPAPDRTVDFDRDSNAALTVSGDSRLPALTAVGVAASQAEVHWLDPDGSDPGHGCGWTGAVTPAGSLTFVSLVRGPWELRLVQVEALAAGVDPAAVTLRIGGWPVVGDPATIEAATTEPGGPVAQAGRTPRSRIAAVATGAPIATTASVAVRPEASPLGEPALIPYLDYRVQLGAWYAALVELAGTGAEAAAAGRPAAILALRLDSTSGLIDVTWPDGARHSLTVGQPHDPDPNSARPNDGRARGSPPPTQPTCPTPVATTTYNHHPIQPSTGPDAPAAPTGSPSHTYDKEHA